MSGRDRVDFALRSDERLVRAALEIDSGLRDSTIDFVESLGRRVIDERRELSPAQRARLREILAERARR